MARLRGACRGINPLRKAPLQPDDADVAHFDEGKQAREIPSIIEPIEWTRDAFQKKRPAACQAVLTQAESGDCLRLLAYLGAR
jgi:hypothetical protein